MPYPLRLIDLESLRSLPGSLQDHLKPGDFWYAPWLTERVLLSPEYLRDWQGKRPPIVIHLPDRSDWCIDGVASNLNGHGWVITGEPPKLTAHPSIGKYTADGKGFTYHGWLKDGVLSDDIEGKTYERR